MKNKFLLFITTIIIMCQALSYTVYANTADEIDDAISGIISFYANDTSTSSVNTWIDESLTELCGNGGEWFILSLSRYQQLSKSKYDFSKYTKALLTLPTENLNPTAKERVSLTLIATGTDNVFIQDTIDTSLTAQGIMSLIWGLHILNNGYTSAALTTDEVTNQLLSLQHADGGFSIMGNYGDVDVTAMTITALAPYYDNPIVQQAIDNALTFLKTKQNDDGTFSSYGVPNAESTAQVLLALSSLSLDAKTYTLKSDTSIIDALLSFRLSDGSFCHSSNAETNTIATQQALYSLISYKLYKENLGYLFIFPKSSSEITDDTIYTTQAVTNVAPVITNAVPTHAVERNNDFQSQPSIVSHINIKTILICVLVVIWLVSILTIFIKKKHSLKSYAFPTILIAILIALVALTKIESKDQYFNPVEPSPKKSIGSVTLSIDCLTTLNKENTDSNSYFPENGYLLKDSVIQISEDSTAFSILLDYCRQNDIQLDFTGSTTSPYVRGINYLYEFDYGPLSGWMYYVNGNEPEVSAGQYTLKNNDIVYWKYSCEIGKDIEH